MTVRASGSWREFTELSKTLQAQTQGGIPISGQNLQQNQAFSHGVWFKALPWHRQC